MKSKHLIICLFLCSFISNVASPSFADVRSSSGTILFDVESDQNPEMQLNTTGLKIGSGTTTGSNLQINGSLSFSFLTYSSNSLIQNTSVVLVDTLDNDVTLTLPYAGNHMGQLLRIKKVSDQNTLYLRGNGNTIDQYISLEILPTGETLSPSLTLLSDGGQWRVLESTNYSGNIPVTSSLLAWYNFDATSGNQLSDQSGQSNAGTLKNSGGTFSFSGQEGIANKGLYFNGVDNYVEIVAGSGSDYDINTSNFSLSCWFKSNSNGRIFHTSGGNDSDDNDHVGLRLEASGNIIFSWDPGSANANYEITGSYNDNQWHHVVGIRNGQRTGLVYVDGILAFTDNDASGGTSGINIFTNAFFGRSVSGSGYFQGYIDEFRLFNKILTEQEIQLLYLQH